MEAKSRVYIAGHQGLVGSAILRYLRRAGYRHLITRARSELDLTRQPAVERFFQQENPEYVFLAAAKVGGIIANSTYPAEFIRDNLLIQTNVLDPHFQFDFGIPTLQRPSASLFIGVQALSGRTEANTQWVKKKTSRFSSPSTDF